ncbi:Prefoldin subunit 1 [Aspergillus hancockii]|nr:Prefoldin subunit 1 [Aspergillus hancockii]
MSLPNEALQKLLHELENRIVSSQQQIGLAKAQMTTKQKAIRLLELTSNEMGTLPSDTRVYEGVGKMFVGVPRSTVDKRLVAERAELRSDVSGLEKKLNSLELTHKNSLEHYERFVKSGGKA